MVSARDFYGGDMQGYGNTDNQQNQSETEKAARETVFNDVSLQIKIGWVVMLIMLIVLRLVYENA